VQSILDQVQHPDRSLSVETYLSDRGVMGVDVAVEMDAPAGASELCQVIFHLASEHQLVAFDPQLGRAVTETDAELIAQHYAQSSAFSLAAPLATLTQDDRRLSPGLRLWLLVLGLGGLALLLARLLHCAFD
jgi:hypothetical protein